MHFLKEFTTGGMPMSEPVLLVERKQGIATLTLNRPKAMNALSRQLVSSIAQAFQDLKQDTETGVVILTGAGRAFCAGIDLKELSEMAVSERGSGASETLDMIQTMEGFDRPIIGAINGVAITGGFELALACDILIASTQARFADTHARVGVLPGWGLSQRLCRMIGIGRAKELAFTGNYLPADQALAWGLVNRVVEPEDLLPVCRTLASDMLSCVPGMVASYKRMIDRGYGMALSEGLRMEKEVSLAHAHKLTADFIASQRQGVQERGRQQTKG
jgi:enoyl-CoA hydratase/carnithine racemase